MSIESQIEHHLGSLPEPKQAEMRRLHEWILSGNPALRLWFDNGVNPDGKAVMNPTIGYGETTLRYANGSTKEFFAVGLSANATGFSVFVMGLGSNDLLKQVASERIGKAKVTGYCIRFKKTKEIDLDVLKEAMSLGFGTSGAD